MMRQHKLLITACIVMCILCGCGNTAVTLPDTSETRAVVDTNSSYPEYADSPYCEVNGNIPFFSDNDITSASYENYSELDSLNRPGTAMACLGIETMPAENETRGEIGMIKPAGWHTVKYPDVISDLYLYNRCHLIGWQLSGENANEKNLITGTRYLNVTGMLPFENQTADYIRNTGNHVIYRVTPIYTGSNLICNGLLMEAKSVEDNGLQFCVYCYNVQPGITIDYATGGSWKTENNSSVNQSTTEISDYILNTNSMKIHRPECTSVDKISANNRKDYHGSISDLLSEGYETCKQCNPE